MKVLFFYQHFWPDSPPYANMLRAMGENLVASGHDVRVLTAQPSYKEDDRSREQPEHELLNGIQVRRLPRLPLSLRYRLISQLGRALFPLRACLAVALLRLKGEAPDVIVAATIPPVINGLFALLAARLSGARLVYHLQDIYPEIGAAGGLWSSHSWRHRWLLKLDTFTARRASRCVVLSDDMRDALARRGQDTSNVVVINNFMLSSFDSAASAPARSNNSAVRRYSDIQQRSKLVFAGNLGRFQGLDDLLDAFLSLEEGVCDLELHFLGDGAMADTLKQKAKLAGNVHFHGHQPFEAASRFIADCDAGIVSIQPDVYRFAYPSKTLTYLGLGVPLLAIVEPESGMAKDIATHKLGVAAAGRSRPELQQAFIDLDTWLKVNKDRSKSIKQWFDRNATADVAFARWNAMLDVLGDDMAVALKPNPADRYT